MPTMMNRSVISYIYSHKGSIIGAILIALSVGAYIAYPFAVARYHASLILQKCNQSERREQCIAAALSQMILNTGNTSSAFSVVHALLSTDPTFADRCSDVLSFAAIDAYHSQLSFEKLTLDPTTIDCNYAFVQSFAREMVSQERDTVHAQEWCAQVAAQLNALSPSASAECYRGVGQALPFIVAANIGHVEKMVSSSVRSCEDMTHVKEERQLCVGGAFNYLDVRASKGEYGLTSDAFDPASICKQQKEEYQPVCYGNSKRTILTAVSNVGAADFGVAMQQIISRYSGLDKQTLYLAARTLAYDQSLRSEPNPDYPYIAAKCGALTTGLRQQCISGFATGLAKNGPPGEQYVQIRDFCDEVSKQLGPEVGDLCPDSGTVDFLRGEYDDRTFQKACAVLRVKNNSKCI